MKLAAIFKAGVSTLREPQLYGRGGNFAVGSFGGTGWMTPPPGTSYDYKTEAGQRYDNCIVFLAINYIVRRLNEAPVVVQHLDDDGEWRALKSTDPASSLARAFNNPNPDYDRSVLLWGICLSMICRGTAYLYKRRSNDGSVIGFRYIPNRQIRPRADKYNEEGTKLVTYYEYRPWLSGTRVEIPVQDIVKIQWGQNPDAQAEGVALLESCLREICTVNELSTFEASLLRNAGVPGIIFVPKADTTPRKTSGGETGPDTIQRRVLRDEWREFTRDNRGEPFIVPRPVDVHEVSHNPREMVLDKIATFPVSVICASIGLDPMVLGLPSTTKTFNNYAEAREASYEDCICPNGWVITGQASMQLLSEARLDTERYRIAFDWSKIRALQPDRDKEHMRARSDWLAGGLTLDEFRNKIGEKVDASGRGAEYYTDIALPGLPGNTEGASEPRTGRPQPAAEADAKLKNAENDLAGKDNASASAKKKPNAGKEAQSAKKALALWADSCSRDEIDPELVEKAAAILRANARLKIEENRPHFERLQELVSSNE